MNFVVCDLYLNKLLKMRPIWIGLLEPFTLKKDYIKALKYNYKQIICSF